MKELNGSTRVLIFRHAKKEGTSLSPEGIKDAMEFGRNLPESMRGFNIVRVGGSMHIRSGVTALLVAMGAGVDEFTVLDNQAELGSFKELSKIVSDEKFGEAIKKSEGNNIVALRSIVDTDNYKLIKKLVVRAIIDSTNSMDGGNEAVLLGTHSPFLEMFYEYLLGAEYGGVAKELDYVMVDVDQEGDMELIETSLNP